VIDVETIANNIVDGNLRDSNSLKDIMALIAKTTSHNFKSSTYGSDQGMWSKLFGRKPNETEKSFAKGILEGYIASLDESKLTELDAQFKKFEKDYGSNVNKFLGGGFLNVYNNALFQDILQSKAVRAAIDLRLQTMKKPVDLSQSVLFRSSVTQQAN
jgi:hypothetical protein